MNREEAMDKAVEIVSKWAEAPTATGRNFTNQAEAFASLQAKTDAALKIADFLWEPEDVQTVEVRTLEGKTREVEIDASREE